MEIQKLESNHLRMGFLETLSSLAEVNLNFDQAYSVLWQRAQNPYLHTFVVVINNEVVGTASIFFENKFIHKGGKVGFIEDVAVHPSHQQQGIGKFLLNYLIDLGKKEKCYKLVLNCKKELVDYYKKFGFINTNEGMRL